MNMHACMPLGCLHKNLLISLENRNSYSSTEVIIHFALLKCNCRLAMVSTFAYINIFLKIDDMYVILKNKHFLI